MEQSTIVGKAFHIKFLTVEVHVAALATCARDVIDALHHEGSGVVLELRHAELVQVRPELDACVCFARILLDLGFCLSAHVGIPLLLIELAAACCLYNESSAEDVCQLGTKAIAASRDLLLRVVVVVTCKQVAEYELRNEDLVLLVDLNWQPLAIVPDLDAFPLLVDLDLDTIHALVALQVVCCIHQDLIKDLIQGWHVADAAVLHLPSLIIPDPQLVVLFLHRANVGVRAQQDVLDLRLLLIDLLHSLAPLKLATLCLVACPFLQFGLGHLPRRRCQTFFLASFFRRHGVGHWRGAKSKLPPQSADFASA
mmetsp:Transcript_100206/g.251234  ORF Transcript_100206/g.251234 Transcript_100206/m.251234 type:complete len:311 (-) Transcript_100206:12-944(-)